jgi:hypothetical protein
MAIAWDTEDAEFASVNTPEWHVLSFVYPGTTDGATQTVFSVYSFFPCINATYFDNFMAVPFQ